MSKHSEAVLKQQIAMQKELLALREENKQLKTEVISRKKLTDKFAEAKFGFPSHIFNNDYLKGFDKAFQLCGFIVDRLENE